MSEKWTDKKFGFVGQKTDALGSHTGGLSFNAYGREALGGLSISQLKRFSPDGQTTIRRFGKYEKAMFEPVKKIIETNERTSLWTLNYTKTTGPVSLDCGDDFILNVYIVQFWAKVIRFRTTGMRYLVEEPEVLIDQQIGEEKKYFWVDYLSFYWPTDSNPCDFVSLPPAALPASEYVYYNVWFNGRFHTVHNKVYLNSSYKNYGWCTVDGENKIPLFFSAVYPYQLLAPVFLSGLTTDGKILLYDGDYIYDTNLDVVGVRTAPLESPYIDGYTYCTPTIGYGTKYIYKVATILAGKGLVPIGMFPSSYYWNGPVTYYSYMSGLSLMNNSTYFFIYESGTSFAYSILISEYPGLSIKESFDLSRR